jgi:hypothetical protein
VYVKAKQNIQTRLEEDDADDIWLAMDGWSAVTTGYIGAEICMYFQCSTVFLSIIFSQDVYESIIILLFVRIC